MAAPRTLGINGLGRIGKLTLWYHLAHDDFDSFVVNVGRPVGTSLQSVLEYLGKDSTYGPLHRWLGRLQRQARHPGDRRGQGPRPGSTARRSSSCGRPAIPRTSPGGTYGVTLVVDCTGKFRDPHADADDAQGRAPGPPGRRSPGGGASAPRSRAR